MAIQWEVVQRVRLLFLCVHLFTCLPVCDTVIAWRSKELASPVKTTAFGNELKSRDRRMTRKSAWMGIELPLEMFF